MTVTLDDRQRPEPDVLVIHAAAEGGLDQTTYQADDVLLAVEVISLDSERRDRLALTVPFDIDIDLTEIDKL
jgi:hypothetical protein